MPRIAHQSTDNLPTYLQPAAAKMLMNNSSKKADQKIAIIGAGVAGCAVAGALHDYGIDFRVYDRHRGPGGLWVDNYPNAKVQSTFELYEYPCKKFPEDIRNRSDPPAPTADEMCTYLQEFIDEKGIASKFRFNTNVAGILCTSEDHWIIEFDDFSTQSFSFVIVCNGLVSSKPNKIAIKGLRDYRQSGGIVLHSSERRDNDVLKKARRVLVIGNGKSAVDAACAAADIAKQHGTAPPIQMARRQCWYVPRYLLGILQYKWAFHTRIGSALLPRYFESKSILLVLLHMLFSPLKWLLWRLLEVLLLCQYRLPFSLWPTLGTIVKDSLKTSVLITDEEHLVRLRKGDIDMRIGQVTALKAGGKAVLSTGEELDDIDVVIQATGWQLSYDQFMDSDSIFAGLNYEKDGLDFANDGLWLYRNVLPSQFKGMAFVGANTLTFMNIFTSYIQAYWVAQLLAGEREWPSEEHMKDTIDREKAFKRQYYKASEMRGASVEAYMQHYHDQLFHEMNARSPYKNCLVRPLANLFVPVLPSTMKGCLEPLSSLVPPTTSVTQNEDIESSGSFFTRSITRLSDEECTTASF